MTGASNASSRDGMGRRLSRPRRCRSHHERHPAKIEYIQYGPSLLEGAFAFQRYMDYVRNRIFEMLKIPREYVGAP